MSALRSLRPVMPILIGAAVLLSLSMGLRQSLGLFMQSMTQDVSISIADFTLAIAIQNLVWGLAQPFAGAMATRYGFRPIMLAGSLLYLTALVVMATANGFWGLALGAGVFMGVAMACAASAIVMAVATRAVPPSVRSTILGMVSAAGSLGAVIAAPLGQTLLDAYGWRAGVWGFAILAIGLLPAAFAAGRVDKLALPAAKPNEVDSSTARTAIAAALRYPPFLVMTAAYFVCGMQLVFLTTHLPSYLEICGMDPMLGAQALGFIGAFNVLGSLFFGWAGGRWNKLALLGMIYALRSLVLIWYFIALPTPQTTLIFASIMGFLWLGVAPLVAGAVAEMFGLRWQAMVQGFAFFSHQIGSFVGAFGGGLLYSMLGNYTLAWQLGVAMGLSAGIVQIIFALLRPSRQGAPAAA